ncbi:Methionyl-tRNA formyltransferase [bacterium HR20]|nr:Methionyl-tRNA formyltransferase [bacterium HR20]
MSTPRIVFFGTPEIAVPTLERLHLEWGVCAVVTVPDAPQGRGRSLRPSAVKRAALELGIAPIFEPTSLRDASFATALSALAPDIFCVLAFRILPQSLLSIPRLAFNVHPSLLPKFRGAAPIAHAIIAGERETGVTTFVMSNRVDAGAILLQERLPIPEGATAGDLATLLAPLCAELAHRTIKHWIEGSLTPLPQAEELATSAPKLHAEHAQIAWERDARSIRNFIHGHSPEPGAWTLLDGGVRLKIYRAEIIEERSTGATAGAWRMEGERWIVQCGRGTLGLVEVQLPGKRVMTAAELLRGWRSDRTGTFALPMLAPQQ